MDLALTDSEELLASSVRSFVAREAPTDVLVDVAGSNQGWRPEWAQSMADAGWLGLLVPRTSGGSEATALEAAVVCEELGRGPVPGPFLFSSVLSTLLLRATDASAERDRVLAGVVAGQVVLAPALMDPGEDWRALRDVSLAARPRGAGWVIDGIKLFVPHVEAATHLLVAIAAPTVERLGLALVDVGAPGVSVRRLGGFLPWSYEVALRDVTVDAARCFAAGTGPSGFDGALDLAHALVAAYQVGGCQALLDRSVDYSSSRVQFGVPIGRFQRVQDHIVGLLNALDGARWATYEALWRIDSGRDPRASAHLAKAVASEAYFQCANAAHEVHAGIGSDPKFGITLYTQMSRALYDYLGSPRWHRRRMVDALDW